VIAKRIILLPGTHSSPAARYRIHQFENSFRSLAYEVKSFVPFPDRENTFPDSFRFLRFLPIRILQLIRVLSVFIIILQIRKGDTVIMNRDIIPENRILFFERHLVRKGAILIFDFDDAIYIGHRKKKLDKLLPLFNWVVAGNDYLLNYAKSVNPNSSVIPTVIDTKAYTRKETVVGKKERLTIGWSGSSGTVKQCLPILKSVMEEMSKKYDFTFLVIADKDPNLNWDVKKIEFVKWTPESEVESIKKIDIGLMPLNDSEFERGKCGFKAIQYMAVGIPAVVSPVGVNKTIVSHGVNGFHANSESEWINLLTELLENYSLRIQLGQNARQTILKRYSLEVALKDWEEVLKKVNTATK
jgi:glycosyltransferase involved in cell wall biosynthesis